MQFDQLSQELKDLIFKVLASFNIVVPDQEAVKFERIGVKRGYNSAIHRIILQGGRTFAIKITDHEECGYEEILQMLHNRELEFYEWMEGVKGEKGGHASDFTSLLQFYGGTRCDKEPGILIFNDLSSRVGIQPCYITGYTPDLVMRLIKSIAGYQSAYLSSDKAVSIGEELIDYDIPMGRTAERLHEATWLTAEEECCLRRWLDRDNLFEISTDVPESIEGISPVLAHCDLWNGNMIFEQKGDSTELLAVLDWQTFKIGNPLIDMATLVGENMSTEDRREYTETFLKLYVDEMGKRKGGFKKEFDMTVEKARSLLNLALRWPCVQLSIVVVLIPNEDRKEEGQEMGRMSIRLRELIKDVLGK